MIKAEYIQGKHTIRIETAESLKDAEENNFPSGIFVRHFVDGKKVDNYSAMIMFIVEEAKKNNSSLIPAGIDLMKQREEMLKRQQENMLKQFEELKKQYSNLNIPSQTFDFVNEMMNKLNPMGIRIKQ